jgi:hypothetical protein
MVRTQIQLPDALYRQLKALSDAQEWSLAETLRRGAELLLQTYPPSESKDWQLPAPIDVGEVLAPVEQFRELANAREPD